MKAPSMVYVLATELYAIKMGISFVLDAYLCHAQDSGVGENPTPGAWENKK